MIEKTAAEIRAINQSFIEKLGQAGGIAQIAKTGGEQIATRVQEESFLDKVYPPIPVTPDECITEVDSDTLYKLVSIKPEYTAVILNADGESPDVWMKGNRVKVYFFPIKTEVIRKSVEEILAMSRPIIEAIQEDLPKYIADKKDEKFVSLIETAITASSKTNNWADNGDYWDRTDAVALFKLLDGDRLVADKILVAASVLDNAGSWPATDVGDAFASTAVKQGWDGDRLLGRQLIQHHKDEITKDGSGKHRVWAFATEWNGRKTSGVNYSLEAGSSPLLIDVSLSNYAFQAVQMQAFAIINTDSVAQSVQQ